MSKIDIDKFIESWMELMHETGEQEAFRQMKESLQKQGLTFEDGKVVDNFLKKEINILSGHDYICLKDLGNGKFTKDAIYHSPQDDWLIDNNDRQQPITLWARYFREAKPTDVHKFNVGDWVVYDGWITRITGVYEDGYTNSNQGFIKKEYENEMRLLGSEDVIYIEERYDDDDYKAKWLIHVKNVAEDSHLETHFNYEITNGTVYCGENSNYWGYLNDLGKNAIIRLATDGERDSLYNLIDTHDLIWDGEYYIKRCKQQKKEKKTVNWVGSDYDYAWKAVHLLERCIRESTRKKDHEQAYDYKTIEDWIKGLMYRIKSD